MSAADGRAYVLKEAVIMILDSLIAIVGGITCMKLSSEVSPKFAAKNKKYNDGIIILKRRIINILERAEVHEHLH